ncbi:MAG: hypothetical protein ACKVUT_05885 [Gaiella sp.]
MRKSVVLLLAVLGAVAFAAAALAASAGNPVIAAAKKTLAAKTSTVRFSGVISAQGQETRISGSGKQRGRQADVTMRLAGPYDTISMRVILLREATGFVMYMRSALLAPQLPPGKTWIRYDLEKAGRELGLDFSSLVGTQSTAFLEAGLVSTKRVGTSPILGVRSVRYRATVDYERAAAENPALQSALARLRASGAPLTRVPMDVWVGPDGRFRRVRFVQRLGSGAARVTSSISVTTPAYDVPVTLKAPPAGVTHAFTG